tara:strand:- start:111 stop:560 length:450 start_codon:yes stop_codon:yes gene_type:complete
MNCNYKDKIISYIENDLTKQEMAEFESELEKNSELQLEFNEMKTTLNSFKNLPKIETSNDFIVNLNNRIDEYESSKIKIFNNVFGRILNNNYLPQISIGAVTLIFLLAINYFGFTNFDTNSNTLLSNSSEVVNTDDSEVADADSLDVIK